MNIDYGQLLDMAKAEFDSFSLVWRDDFEFSDTALELEDLQKPHLIEEKRTDEWPGTQLESPDAVVRYYDVNDETLELLRRVRSVLGWVSPELPEDLAFYRSGVTAFASVSHEGYGWYTKT